MRDQKNNSVTDDVDIGKVSTLYRLVNGLLDPDPQD